MLKWRISNAEGRRADVEGLEGRRLLALSVQYFDVPPDVDARHTESITAGPDGAVWFTSHWGDKVGRVSASGSLRFFTTPYANILGDITAGGDGNLWFTVRNSGKIVRMTPSGGLTEFNVPGSFVRLDDVARGPDGNVWFTANSIVGKVTPSGTVTTYAANGAGFTFGNGLTVGADGAMWFAAFNGIGRVTTGGQVTVFQVPDASPDNLTRGPDGRIWFTDTFDNTVSRMSTSGQVSSYLFPSPDARPGGMTMGSDGNLWVTENSRENLARITPGGVITEFPLDTFTSPGDITTGPDGHLWFCTFFRDIGRVTLGPLPPPPPPPPPATGSIRGLVFDDVNGNGTRNAGEPALAGRQVYIDADRDGTMDAGETRTLTDAVGNYRFSGLPAGSYRVREKLPSGWRATAPGSGYHDVTLAAGGAATGRNFGASRSVLISGNVYHDQNANGSRNSGEPGLGAWTVWLDANNNGTLESGETRVATDSAGNYRFNGLAAGTHRVRAARAGGWRQTQPSSGAYTVTLVSGATTTGRNFGMTRKVRISGTVFNDANGDRVRNAAEGGLAGWRVYLDADNDGVRDAGEVSVLTDSLGNYRFDNLAAGTYVVREVLQSGWTRTSPTGGSHTVTLASGAVATGKSFGNRR